MTQTTKMFRPLLLWAALVVLGAPDEAARAEDAARARHPSDAVQVRYKTVEVGDLDIFYREAGPKDAPTVLLLHGFPTSSQMFRYLIPKLADTYHVVAPDYPGYGYSSMPPHERQQPAALPAVAGVLPQAAAADADRVGEERSNLPARRSRALQA